jgi:multicomponent Na+:H+ antiporter subunit G
MIGEVLVAVGAVLAAIAALGAVRLDGILPRTHAVTKAATGGIASALIGTAIALRSLSALTTLLLALALQLFTFPVGANLVAHAVYKRQREADRRAAAGSPGDASDGEVSDGDTTHGEASGGEVSDGRTFPDPR